MNSVQSRSVSSEIFHSMAQSKTSFRYSHPRAKSGGSRIGIPSFFIRLILTGQKDSSLLTEEEMGEAVWVVTRLDHLGHKVEYHRVEPGRYVARIGVSCTAISDRLTEAATTYEFIGLSEAGNAEIAAMTQESYAQKMMRWSRWINEYLRKIRQQVGS